MVGSFNFVAVPMQSVARVPKDDVLFDENPTRFSLEHFRESLGNLKNPLCGCPQMLC